MFGFDLADRADGPACVPRAPARAPVALSTDDLADTGEGRLAVTRSPAETRAVEARLSVVSDDGDYRAAQVSARGLDTLENAVVTADLPVLADRALAADWSERLLENARLSGERARLVLPPSRGFLEPGDPVVLEAASADRVWRVTALDGAASRRAELAPALAGPLLRSGPEPGAGETVLSASRPLIRLLDLPLGARESAPRGGLWAVAWAQPWPGGITLSAGPDASLVEARASIAAPAHTGVLETELGAAAEGRWDRANTLTVRLRHGALASVEPAAALAGETLVAIEGPDGWKVIAYAGAELQADGAYRLSALLRGLGGSPSGPKPAGAAFVVLDGAGAVLPVRSEERGADLVVSAQGVGAPQSAVRTVTARYDGADLRPLRPVHPLVRRRGGGLDLSWVRRGRIDADSWTAAEIPLDEARETYRVELVDGAALLAVLETAAPRLTLDAGFVAAQFPGGLAAGVMRIAQLSDAYGPGAVLEAPLDPSAYG